MALTVVATPGASNANSYATLTEGNTYHESRLQTDVWDDASDDEKNRALVMATRLIDLYFTWDGTPTYEGQALAMPRTGLLTLNDEDLDETTIPDLLRDATAEFGRQLLAADRQADSDVIQQGLSSLRAGPVTLEFNGTAQKQVIPDAVIAMLSLWAEVAGGEGTIALERV